MGCPLPGPIRDRSGHVYGQHAGLPGYTIGQRKGLGISGAAEPLFVVALDHADNALIVGTAAELGCTEMVVERVNWTLDVPPSAGTELTCKIRYKAEPVACILHPENEGTVCVRFSRPLRDITPGQGAVFYAGEHCLGGGIIARQRS